MLEVLQIKEVEGKILVVVLKVMQPKEVMVLVMVLVGPVKVDF